MPSIRSFTSSFTPSFAPLNLLRLLPATFALSAALFAVSVHASDIDDVNQLLKAGKQAQALTKVEQSLTTKPRDPQLRFLKGVIQTELGKPQDAIGTFTKLTEEYPELPEPYNNLAVLHASGGQFDKARAALEMAIRTNPSYSTAHENLGDIYANLASQAYSKALQLGGSSSTLQPKLTLIRELFTPSNKGVNPNAVRPVAVTPLPATPTTPVAVAPTTPVAKPAVPVATTPAATAPTTTTVVPAAPATSDKDIEQTVRAWAAAWSSKDMTAYLGSYAKNFDTPKNLPRKAWEEERRDRIMGKSRISVKVSDIVTKSNGSSATVKFRQTYDADALSTSSRKTLELTKVGDRWLIAKEKTGG
jgi:tetratricopeptide (TPR) repeat protein